MPAKAGVAAGTLTAGTTKVTLAYAYALGPIDFGGTVYQIVLTDAPIPAAGLRKEIDRGGQALLRASKLSGISMLMDSDGYIRNIVPFIGALRGEKMLASAGSLKSFTVRQGVVTGQGSLPESSTMAQGWSYAASWNAALVKP